MLKHSLSLVQSWWGAGHPRNDWLMHKLLVLVMPQSIGHQLARSTAGEVATLRPSEAPLTIRRSMSFATSFKTVTRRMRATAQSKWLRCRAIVASIYRPHLARTMVWAIEITTTTVREASKVSIMEEVSTMLGHRQASVLALINWHAKAHLTHSHRWATLKS